MLGKEVLFALFFVLYFREYYIIHRWFSVGYKCFVCCHYSTLNFSPPSLSSLLIFFLLYGGKANKCMTISFRLKDMKWI